MRTKLVGWLTAGTLVLSIAAVTLVVYAAAQQPDSMLAKVRRLGLPEAAGAIPVIYVPSAKGLALRQQKSLEAAHTWYENKLNVRMPLVLALLDPDARQKISDPVAIPHTAPPGLIVMPPSNTLPGHPEWIGEPALFHEDGHLLASEAKIWSGNPFVNELVAQIFAVAYMAAERPDLSWVVDDLGAGRANALAPVVNPPGYTPRYTSLADLDYLVARMGIPNYIWFQGAGLGRLAVFLAKDQSFPIVVEKLQKAFPLTDQKQETLEEVSHHLETIRPGFLKAAGSLVGPTTIPRIMSSPCPELTAPSVESYVVVRNNTANPLVVTDLEGKELQIPAHSWRTYGVRAGTSLKLADGSCLVAREEPTLAVIDE
jgi:hypothetical protein